MRRLRALWIRATGLFGRDRRERELHEELAAVSSVLTMEDRVPARGT